MSESKSDSGAVKVVLAVGFVLVVLTILGFGGVFLLIRYSHEQAREAAERERMLREQEESTQTLGEVGGALGASFGNKLAEELDDTEDAEALKDVAEAVGGAIGREIGRSRGSKQFKDSLKAAGEAFEATLQKDTNAGNTASTESVDLELPEGDSSS